MKKAAPARDGFFLLPILNCASYRSACQSPLFPPCFSSTRTSVITIPPIDRLAHVVNGQQAHLHGGEGFHFDPGLAVGFHGSDH